MNRLCATKLVWLLLPFLLAGCAGSSSLRNEQFREMHYGMTVRDYLAVRGVESDDMHFWLVYELDGVMFGFGGSDVEDVRAHYFHLFANGQLAALVKVSKMTYLNPPIDLCALYPPREDVNSAECLRQTTEKLISERMPEPFDFLDPDGSNRGGSYDEAGALAMGAVVASFAWPVMLVGLPVAGVVVAKERGAKDWDIPLGADLEDYRELIDSLPEKAVRLKDGNGAFYIPDDGLRGGPAFAAGVRDGRIIWVRKRPGGVCGSPFDSDEPCWIPRKPY